MCGTGGCRSVVDAQGKAVRRQWRHKERQCEGSGGARKGSEKAVETRLAYRPTEVGRTDPDQLAVHVQAAVLLGLAAQRRHARLDLHTGRPVAVQQPFEPGRQPRPQFRRSAVRRRTTPLILILVHRRRRRRRSICSG